MRGALLLWGCSVAAGCQCTGKRDTDPACCFEGHAFVPNALERTPMRGWRSWQAFGMGVDQQILEDTMRGLAKPRQLGGFSSLAAAGYTDVGLDAGYELHTGYGDSCHTKDGHMLVNKTRFPDFNSMTDTAHALNLTASWYLNNDPCPGKNESRVGPTYDTDSADAVRYGFDGVKFDSQGHGPSHNITLWAMALAKASKAAGKTEGILIENCDDKNPTYLLDDPADCPYNHYRTGPDNSPSFYGGVYHVWHWATPYLALREPVPASRPGCWAYPDMLGIGAPVEGTAIWEQAREKGCANMTMDEERSLFALWAVISSPLVLGIDVRDDAVVAKYWPIIANQRALAINAAWAGSPGALLKQSTVIIPNITAPDGTACEVIHIGELPTWLVYAKPLDGGAVAVLLLNLGEGLESGVEVSLDDVLSVSGPGYSAFGVTDVWTGGVVAPPVAAGRPWAPAVSAHNSTFVVLTPQS